ncbi:aminomethyl-transferring glycine dehydrogenase [Nocardioides bigeumensis]|uniref:Glycine dehydrogenase (decarboxylating) n=1 Tax=Nocardioides bigeumensis TaxID=433657 RepID=A0ABP5KH48_9ACTN
MDIDTHHHAARAQGSDTRSETGFVSRHIGPSPADQAKMLADVGYPSLAALVDAAVPAGIRSSKPLNLPPARDEAEVRRALSVLASMNEVSAAMIGLGYHPTETPAVIRRNVLEDPSWYTAYTPYQPEISQGRLEALLNFQTMVGDLTGLPTANASLLDEPTAVAEAGALMRRANPAGGALLVDHDLLPQTLEVLRTRFSPSGIDVLVFDPRRGLPADVDFFGVVLAYPGCSGEIRDHEELIVGAHTRGALVAVSTDLLALTLLTPPGEQGADIAVGSAQRFGVPMFYGGPHAGFIAVREGLERQVPGRLVGVSVDTSGHPAYRLALQTREQHIRRDKATSNICTAQVLLAVVAAMYAVYHGPAGLTGIARRTHRCAARIADALGASGRRIVHGSFFDTVLVEVPGVAGEVVGRARERGVLLREVDADHVAISCSETTTDQDVSAVLAAFDAAESDGGASVDHLPSELARTSRFLTHAVFSSHHTETGMLRYLQRLAGRDFALDRGMIPLGSCTMKLNATTEMEAIGHTGFADLHPFAPADHARGYRILVDELETWLAEITGYAKVSVQPNAGSQGELAGLLAIRGYHLARGEPRRDVCLIPASAHGTNAASAVMAGMRVVVVKTRPDGTIDLDDLQRACTEHADALAAIMVTYPSTHGVYEESITRLCELVHDHGGQVYIDGANLNALVGIARPGEFGGDVSHLNLHKTFCIPHGGGGPGVGPVAVADHLAPFLPGHQQHPDPARRGGSGAVSGAPYGSAGILPIPWAYIAMLGAEGLTTATEVAVLSANYIASRLAPHFPVLYTGANGLVAHECIIDLRPLTAQSGVTVDDVAKRLTDYGFHAPTMSFPVAGTLMIEPTESETVAEIDRFCDAMISIRAEVDAVVDGTWPLEDSPLRLAPHTSRDLIGEWDRPYTRERGAFPAGHDQDKYWPPVNRLENAHGDRYLVCSCPPPEYFENPAAPREQP